VNSLGPSWTFTVGCGEGMEGVTKTWVAPLPGDAGAAEGAGAWKRRVYSPGCGAAAGGGPAGTGVGARVPFSSKEPEPKDDWKYLVNSPGCSGAAAGAGVGGGLDAGAWNI
jgi:hypothetical protein